MKIIYFVFTFFFIYLFLIINSCGKFKCEEEVGPDQEAFTFRLVDENTRETVIAAWGTKYDNEDVEFKQDSNNSIKGLQIEGDGIISFFPVEDIGSDIEEFIGKSFTNIYYLFLDAKNEERETDVDTIVISFDFVSVEEKCVPIDFGTTTITYNDSIYHQGDFIHIIDFVKKI